MHNEEGHTCAVLHFYPFHFAAEKRGTENDFAIFTETRNRSDNRRK